MSDATGTTGNGCRWRADTGAETCGLTPGATPHAQPFGLGHPYLPPHGFARLVRADWDAADEETRVCLVDWCNTRQAEHDRTFPETLYRETSGGRVGVEPVPPSEGAD